MEYILVGVAAGATFIAVMAAIDLGVFLLGAAGGALLANLALHFVRLPTEFQHEFIFRALFLLVPAIALGLATVYLINFLIRPMSAFVGSYFLAASLSRGLSRLGLAASAPFDPPVFFGPLELASDNPSTSVHGVTAAVVCAAGIVADIDRGGSSDDVPLRVPLRRHRAHQCGRQGVQASQCDGRWLQRSGRRRLWHDKS